MESAIKIQRKTTLVGGAKSHFWRKLRRRNSGQISVAATAKSLPVLAQRLAELFTKR